MIPVICNEMKLNETIYDTGFFFLQENATAGNDADWLGLYKSNSDRTLPEILKGYIGRCYKSTPVIIYLICAIGEGRKIM
jgi:hypothetical protein